MATGEIIAFLASLSVSAAPFTSEQLEFFEKQVRPILAERCYKCHSAQSEKLKGGLFLDSREGIIKGGDDGPVITPGEPEKSKLIEAINYQNPQLQMPPKGKLPHEQIEALTAWIKMGAPWPAEDLPKAATQTASFDLEKRRREHWAWHPIKPPGIPTVRDKSWPYVPIDVFILSKLEKENLRPAPAASARTLIRRLYFDLIGLPPSPEEVECFLRDSSPKAYEKVVDHLLASPAFGERWARHWLDLVRYAETLGHEFDYSIHNAWRYRDYVIRAFNSDVPYDQFVSEHIAGDLLPNPRLNPTQHFNESVIGTAFFWLGQRDHSPVDVRQHQAEIIDNQIDVMSKTFLGLTVACARCHDHKFDAISTKDFYSLYGILESSRYAQKQTVSTALPKIQALRKLKKKIRRAADSEWSQQADRVPYALLDGSRTLAPHDPLYPWSKLSSRVAVSPQELHRTWNMLLDEARSTLASRSETNSQLFAVVRNRAFEGWFPDGEAFRLTSAQEANFVIGDSNIIILAQDAVDDRVISRRLEGALRSPGFQIAHGYVHVLVAGRDARIRVCVDNFTMIRDPIYGGLIKYLNNDRPEWFTFDLRMWQGHRAYIELCDTSVPDPADEGKKEGYGNSGWISASRVVFSNYASPPEVPFAPLWLELLGQDPPDSLDALAARYKAAFKRSLQSWASGQVGNSSAERAQLEFLDEVVRALGTSVALTSQSSHLNDLIAEYHRIEASIPEPIRVPGMADGDGCDEHVFIRGNHKSPGELAPRHFLTALSNEKSVSFKCGSGRRELASCVTAPSDPLLARVMVNRVWLHLFGRGIVPTPDDFGKLGQPPTHPELLDWLANWYRTDARWSTKKLIRLVVTSKAYRMSSQPADAVAEGKDPDDLLWHRMPIRRLEGETIRDAMLAISGRLDHQMFGPSVPTHLTEFMDGRGRPGSSGPLDGAGRRSIYLEVRRNFLSPMMRSFDTPVPFTTIGRRTVSNVPAQSLILLNDPFVSGQALFWARRVLAESQATPEQRISRIYSMAFARPPTTNEVMKARAFLKQQGQYYDVNPSASSADDKVWADFCHVLFNLKEFIFLE